jgi:hypothetical protein
VLAAATAFLIYLMTMFPGLAGLGDSPKLQFVGSVMGTPHAPGYPLYVSVSWLFSQVPIGSLAYRVNVMSAVFGAVAVGLLAAFLLAIGVRPLAAGAVALAAGLGQVFWSQAIIAEVYTLNAAIFLAMLCALVQWRVTRRDGDFLWATAAFGLGLAHHPTLWLTAPAVAVFVITTDRRVVIRPRLLALVMAILGMGVSMYGLIWLRTVQAAPLLEVRADSVWDILRHLRGEQFAGELFVFGPEALARERVPLVAGWIGAEVLAGLLFAVIGVVGLFATSWQTGLLLALVWLSVTAFALQHSAADIEVFLILPMLVTWIWTGVGFERALRWIDRWAPSGGHRAVTSAAAVLTLALPLHLFVRNLDQNNERGHRYEMEYFDALFRGLPDDVVFVEEDYVIDSMVRYKIIGERRVRTTNAGTIPAEAAVVSRWLADGFGVYAFATGRQKLEFQGIRFEPMTFDQPVVNRAHRGDTHMGVLVGGVYAAVR